MFLILANMGLSCFGLDFVFVFVLGFVFVFCLAKCAMLKNSFWLLRFSKLRPSLDRNSACCVRSKGGASPPLCASVVFSERLRVEFRRLAIARRIGINDSLKRLFV